MELQINNQTVAFKEKRLSIQTMLDIQHPTTQKGIAVAVNNNVIPKVQWATHMLNNTDDILIITATQGG
ncbi:MAG: sulfur carrier protein ThiS [Flavobacteriaceae bacterium]|jgi:sulfur carrier protein|nr:sulfur carrier protein ThiS [Flavobacteriaceae bacterium]